MAAANDLRPVQARGNLEQMMKRQLELRRSETETVHAKCDALESKLGELRASVRQPPYGSNHAPNQSGTEQDTAPGLMEVDAQSTKNLTTEVSPEDVLRWAEEIG